MASSPILHKFICANAHSTEALHRWKALPHRHPRRYSSHVRKFYELAQSHKRRAVLPNDHELVVRENDSWQWCHNAGDSHADRLVPTIRLTEVNREARANLLLMRLPAPSYSAKIMPLPVPHQGALLLLRATVLHFSDTVSESNRSSNGTSWTRTFVASSAGVMRLA